MHIRHSYTFTKGTLTLPRKALSHFQTLANHLSAFVTLIIHAYHIYSTLVLRRCCSTACASSSSAAPPSVPDRAPSACLPASFSTCTALSTQRQCEPPKWELALRKVHPATPNAMPASIASLARMAVQAASVVVQAVKLVVLAVQAVPLLPSPRPRHQSSARIWSQNTTGPPHCLTGRPRAESGGVHCMGNT